MAASFTVKLWTISRSFRSAGIGLTERPHCNAMRTKTQFDVNGSSQQTSLACNMLDAELIPAGTIRKNPRIGFIDKRECDFAYL